EKARGQMPGDFRRRQAAERDNGDEGERHGRGELVGNRHGGEIIGGGESHQRREDTEEHNGGHLTRSPFLATAWDRDAKGPVYAGPVTRNERLISCWRSKEPC